MDKIFSSISKINEELLQRTETEDKNQLWVIYYLIYYSGQLYPHLYTRLLFNDIFNKLTISILEEPFTSNELFYQSSLRVCFKIGHLHKLSNRDLDIFNEKIIDILLQFVEHTRNYHDESANYSIIEFLMVLSYQIQNNIKARKLKNKSISNIVDPILTILEKRINHSKTLSENLIFLLNRTNDMSVKYYLLKFLNLIFTTPSLDKFFYTNDIPVLLDITLRELWNLTDENTHIQKAYLILLENLIKNTISNNIPYRYHDITKLLYTISQRGKDSCYSNKIQHDKLVSLSNLAQRILNTFSNILDTSSLTPVHSVDNLVALNKQMPEVSPIKTKDKKKKSKISNTLPSTVSSIHDNDKNQKRVNPLNKSKEKPVNINNQENEEDEEENEHEKLSQRARDIFMKSYQQYHENTTSVDNSAVTTSTIITNGSDSSELNQESSQSSAKEIDKEDIDHEKLSKKAMEILMRSYQQYQNDSASSTPIAAPLTENTNDLINQDISNQEPPMSPLKNDNDHDKLSQKAMDIFMKSLQQYHNEQDVIHSATLPQSYNKKNENGTQSSIITNIPSQTYQDDIYSANSYFPHDASNPSQSYYTNMSIINNNSSSNRYDNDNVSISSNSTISNSNTFAIPSRLDSMSNRSIVDPIERHQSPFSDCYQIPTQNQAYDRYKSRPLVASPALSAVSYQSNYSISSINNASSKSFLPAKANNIFKRDNLNNNIYSKPNNAYTTNYYNGRKSSHSSITTTFSYSPRLNSYNNSNNRVNPINNIFAAESTAIEDPIQRHESPFDDSFSIE
ncbi:hypothetical protein BCR36DRAFT_319693 [Piromyces finnis]|uniref:SPIN90/Ldb17 leucine-rich domain-containing protein n=1 Tax=Piromyces finnis TaxID=1754191 RepID=A0A1Y1VIV3_9FUNG|nr:hypothetical protein BCR36DRAFT_319693 [Piromyces finnis]|eukprot:ORX57337.1 hypothetical protein BCR36DRAFT_319693 [Piromyces finnis]